MTTILFIGRIIVGIFFLINAYDHLFKSSGMVGYAASKGVPSPKLAIMGSGILLLLGALSILFASYTFWGIIALLVFMIPVTFTMHNFWKATDPMTKMNEKISFMKNMAIVGFLLMLMGLQF